MYEPREFAQLHEIHDVVVLFFALSVCCLISLLLQRVPFSFNGQKYTGCGSSTFRFTNIENWHSVRRALTTPPTTTKAYTYACTLASKSRDDARRWRKRTPTKKAHEWANDIVWLTIFYFSLTLLLLVLLLFLVFPFDDVRSFSPFEISHTELKT